MLKKSRIAKLITGYSPDQLKWQSLGMGHKHRSLSKLTRRSKDACWRRDRLPTLVFLGFSCGSAGKESACNAGDLDLISGLGRSPGEGKGYPLQYSSLENSVDCMIHGVAKNQLSFFTFITINTFPHHASLFDLNFSCMFQVESPCQVCGCKKVFILPWSCLFIDNLCRI